MSKATYTIHAHVYDDQEFAPTVTFFPKAGTIEAFYSANIGDVAILAGHWQLVELRDKLTAAIAESPLKCSDPECEEQAVRGCDCCDKRACDEHCTPGGDREGGTNTDGSPYGASAVPAVCWACQERSAA